MPDWLFYGLPGFILGCVVTALMVRGAARPEPFQESNRFDDDLAGDKTEFGHVVQIIRGQRAFSAGMPERTSSE